MNSSSILQEISINVVSSSSPENKSFQNDETRAGVIDTTYPLLTTPVCKLAPVKTESEDASEINFSVCDENSQGADDYQYVSTGQPGRPSALQAEYEAEMAQR